MLTQTLCCSRCDSDQLVSNGHAKNGRLRFQCKDCKKYGRQNPGSNAYEEQTKAIILAAYQERPSLRALQQCLAPALGSSGAPHAFVLQERRDARSFPAPILTRAQFAE